MEYPVISEADGIKLQPERMIIDQLYYCIHEEKVFLFYKDEQELLHCYEVQDTDLVKEITANPNDIDSILQKHANT
ncbi:MAG TPA: hypothetical protein VI033_04990 [Candidatus Nitrosopolaris sp.]